MRSLGHAALLFPLFSIMAAVACSKDPEPPADAGPCARYFDAFIAYQTRCGTPARSEETTTRARERAVGKCKLDMAAPGTSFTSTFIEACAASFKDLSCDARGASDACEVKAGTLEGTAACASERQCASGRCSTTIAGTCGACQGTRGEGEACNGIDLVCRPGMTCSAGKCAVVTKGDVGAPCGGAAACKNGIFCDTRANVCTAPRDVGGACASEYECAFDLTCASGKCVARVAEGGECSDRTPPCAQGFGCDPDQKRCVKLTRVKPGETCSAAALCELGGCTFPESRALKGTCPTIIADGEPCVLADTTRICDEGAACKDGRCVVFDPGQCK
jgi:hypothetical protein